MRTVVLLKQVPEPAEIVVEAATRRIRREGVALQLNPFDRRALLEALRLRDEVGGTVTALSMGPPQAEEVLREAMGLGADRAIHLSDRAFAGADTLATARALGAVLARIGFDLILAGRYSIDSDTGQVPPELAGLLGVELLPGVRRLAIEIEQGRAVIAAECETDEGWWGARMSPPVIATCTDRWATRIPRILPDAERATDALVERWGVAECGLDPALVGSAGSPTSVEALRSLQVLRERRVLVLADDVDRAVEHLLAELVASPRAAALPQVVGPQHTPDGRLAGSILVVAECDRAGRLAAVSRELLRLADELACQQGVGVSLLPLHPVRVAGAPAPPPLDVVALGALGVDLVLAPSTGWEAVHSLAALESILGNGPPPAVLLGPATSLGRGVLPVLAGRLGLGMIGDAIGVECDGDGQILALKPAFGGQIVAPIVSRSPTVVVTLRPGLVAPIEATAARPAAQRREVPAGAPLPLLFPPVVAEGVEVDAGGVALESARIVVCVGYGLGAAGVALAGDLARSCGGEIAATRRVCDLGWLPRQRQVGLSGRNVAPEVYLGLGVRGSFNHTVGIGRAGRVLAVNRDPAAEIFAAADLGIAGDAVEVVRQLLARLALAPPRRA